MGFSDDDIFVLDISYKVCSGLSFFSAIFIILVYIGYKHLRSVFFALIVCMQLADLLNALSYFLSDSSISCKIQGFGINSGAFSSVIWSSIIANSVYNAYISDEEQMFVFKKTYFLLGFLVPFCFSALPFITNSYGSAAGCCWIAGDFEDMWKGISLYGIVIGAIIYNCRTYKLVILEIRSQVEVLEDSSVLNNNMKKASHKFMMYPMILIICYLPALLKFAFSQFLEENLLISLVSGCLVCLVGVFNTLIYACTPVVLSAVKNTLFCNSEKIEDKSKFTLLIQDESKIFTNLQDISYI